MSLAAALGQDKDTREQKMNSNSENENGCEKMKKHNEAAVIRRVQWTDGGGRTFRGDSDDDEGRAESHNVRRWDSKFFSSRLSYEC